jgi:GNAT superfamily N-acetyltransferase
MNETVAASDPFAQLPTRTPLYDGDRLVLVFSLAEMLRGALPWADLAWRPPDVPAELAAEVALSALGGYAFSTTDPALTSALTARGAAELRHAHTMTHSLDPLPAAAPPSGTTIERLGRDDLIGFAAELAAVSVAAYPSGHPDHEHADPATARRELLAYAGGDVIGPFLDVSTVARAAGRAAGACIVVDRPGGPPDAGPWIVDVFRAPALAGTGLGSALIASTLAACREAGLSSLGLAVTDANAPARSSYRRLGFTDDAEGWTLALPETA